MEALTIKQQNLIVNNVVKACSDISKLNGTGYKYLYLCSGFIAHYNIDGFKSHYEDASLIRDILHNAESNTWANFREGDKNYHYYKSKAQVYKKIVDKLHNLELNLWNT
jgi:hypothetical protein